METDKTLDEKFKNNDVKHSNVTEILNGIIFESGYIRYEDFHEKLNHLVSSNKFGLISGKDDDFIHINKKLIITIK